MSKFGPIEVALRKLERQATGIRFSPDAGRLHVYDGQTIHSWKVPGFDDLGRFAIDESERSLDGYCRFLRGGKDILLIGSDDNNEKGNHHVTVRDLDSFALKTETDIQIEHYGLMTILFNRAENRLLLTDCGGTSHIIDFPSGIRTRSVRFDGAKWKIYSPDESELWAVCSYDEPAGYREYLTAFDLETGTAIRRRPPDTGAHIDGLRLFPGGRALLAVEEESLRVCDPKSWELLRAIDVSGSLRIAWGRSGPALAFASNSRLLALSCEYNTKVCIVDLEHAELLGIFEVDKDFCVRLLSFSRDACHCKLRCAK